MNKKNRFYCLIIAISLFLFSTCSDKTRDDDQFIIVSGQNSSIQWELEYPDKDYFFSDLIPISLKVSQDLKFNFLAELIKEKEVWGDFRIYSTSYSKGKWKILLQPVQTGQSLLILPSFTSDDSKIDMDIKPVEFQINSVVDGDKADLSPLINESPEKNLSLFILLILLFLSGAAGVFIILFIRNKRKKTVSQEAGLKEYLEDLGVNPRQDEDYKLIYQNIYRLLIKDLTQIHPGVSISDSPSELVKHLETPSPLNQWALRSLYPILDAMETSFFRPHSQDLSNRYKGDFNIFKEWIGFTESLKTQENKNK